MKKIFSIVTAVVLAIASSAQTAQSVVRLEPEKFCVVVPEGECGPVRLAAEALCRDFGKVTGYTPEIAAQAPAGAVALIVVNDDTEGAAAETAAPDRLEGFESHSVTADAARSMIVMHGADMRGTIYAIYSFSEKILGVPPLWYWCDWAPEHRDVIEVPADYSYSCGSPDVRYRAWFPNDEDLFVPWRKKSTGNNEMWLETMLRLKLNTVEYTATVTTSGTLNSEAMLYKKYGLVLTSHHMVALNNSFANWEAYWRDVRHTSVPALSVKDLKSLKEFWQYSIDAVKESGVENLWQIAFRGKTDQPFWSVFTDAPATDAERGRVISDMVKVQYDMICESTGEKNPFVRMTFYDEISSLLAKGYIEPPAASNMLWTFVAGRRDHYPYDDLVAWENTGGVQLGYYMNLQFYSTGAHLAPAEGPWKMEANYRYVMGKGPLTFSVVNAGNLREFLMEMSANAAMMWDAQAYTTDAFLRDFCALYFGEEHADEAVELYRDFYNSYWNQKTPDFPGGFPRQYIFQDLRHSQVIKMIYNTWNTFKENPLTEIGYESVPGRTFRIEGDSQVDAMLEGLAREAVDFGDVAARCDALIKKLDSDKSVFFYDHLGAYATYMANLAEATYRFVHAYKYKESRYADLIASLAAMKSAKKALTDSEHGVFEGWYDTDDKFEMDRRIEMIAALVPDSEDLTLTERLIKNYDFELNHDGKPNPSGIVRGIPYGWESEGTLRKGANGLDSYGINQDAKNFHGNNVCWINSVPMPEKFTLYQTIPASELEPGTYRVACKLWVEVGRKTNCRLFANDNVQYFGYDTDYTNLLTPGEINTYAGYPGGNTSDIVLRDMEVEVKVDAGEDLTIGIKSGNRMNNGTTATNNAGWFKVDFFRIHKLEGSGVEAVVPDGLQPMNGSDEDTTIYNLHGQCVGHGAADYSRLQPGVYVMSGRKLLKH